jgi:hypothetical protein
MGRGLAKSFALIGSSGSLAVVFFLGRCFRALLGPIGALNCFALEPPWAFIAAVLRIPET